MKVQLQSNAAVINMKVVRFRKEGVEDYIRLQGFNWVVSDSELGNILMGYAYSNQEWSFLEIVQEGGPENFTNPSPDWVRTSGDGRRAEKKTGKHNEK